MLNRNPRDFYRDAGRTWATSSIVDRMLKASATYLTFPISVAYDQPKPIQPRCVVGWIKYKKKQWKSIKNERKWNIISSISFSENSSYQQYWRITNKVINTPIWFIIVSIIYLEYRILLLPTIFQCFYPYWRMSS